jgi:hypothetical protein
VTYDGVTSSCTLGPDGDRSYSDFDKTAGMKCDLDGIEFFGRPTSLRLQITSGGTILIDELYEPHYSTTYCKHADIDVTIP